MYTLGECKELTLLVLANIITNIDYKKFTFIFR